MDTDYQPGDAPLPPGTVVRYEGTDYEIDYYQDPKLHPHAPAAPLSPRLDKAYPDGVAYFLWPVGVARKMDNGMFVRHYVRRTSLSVVRPAPEGTTFSQGYLPKGLRVVGPNGRHGEVNGVDAGEVTIQDHPNFGRQYVGVNWDPVEGDTGSNRRSRPFIDELSVEVSAVAP